jgi:hypothetical protein
LRAIKESVDGDPTVYRKAAAIPAPTTKAVSPRPIAALRQFMNVLSMVIPFPWIRKAILPRKTNGWQVRN